MKNKVLLIGSLPPPIHGSNIYFKSLLESKLGNFFDLVHLDTSDHRDDLTNLGKYDFSNVSISINNFIQLIYQLIISRPRIVYLSPAQGPAYFRDGMFILITKVLSKAKIVEHLHGSNFRNYYNNSGYFTKIFIDLTQKNVDHAIVLGAALKKIFSKWLPESKIHPIMNGLDVKVQYEHKFRNNNILNFFYLGNLVKFKGFLCVIEALILVKKKYPDIALIIAGKFGMDEIKNEYYNLVNDNDLDKNINYLGAVYGEEKIKLLEKGSVLVYPTINDGAPLVIIEALAAGCPIISSKNVGVISEMVIDQITGILLEEQNSVSVANAMIELIESPEKRILMSVNARNSYENNFIFQKNLDQVIKLFQFILCIENE